MKKNDEIPEEMIPIVNQQSNENLQKVKEDILQLIQQQYVPEDEELKQIQLIHEFASQRGIMYASVCAYQYGFIQGKRSERQKKNKNLIHLTKHEKLPF